MRKFLAGVFSLLLLTILLSSCTALGKNKKMKQMEVIVVSTEGFKLPKGAQMTLVLEENGKNIIAENRYDVANGDTYNVNFTYDKKALNKKSEYKIKGKIEYMENLIYMTDSTVDPFEKNKDNIVISLSKQEMESYEFEDTYWSLYKIGDETVDIPKNPYLLFNSINGVLNGYTGVNVLSGSYEIDGTALKFGSLITTRRYSLEYSPFEVKVLNILNETTSYEVYGDKMRLIDRLGNTLALFKAEKL